MAEKMSIEDRIKHFLRVAENAGATAEERDTANAQAERLMAKHLIDRLSLDVNSDQYRKEQIVRKTVWVHGGGGTFSMDLFTGMTNVAQAMQCYTVYNDWRAHGTYRDGKIAKGINMVLVGFESDVDAAIQTINSLLTQAPLALRQYAKSAEGVRVLRYADRQESYRIRCGFMQHFGHGAASRIRETRKSVLDETGNEGKALVLSDRRDEVNNWVRDNMNVGRAKADRRMSSSAATMAGYAAGRNAQGANKQGTLGQNSRAVAR